MRETYAGQAAGTEALFEEYARGKSVKLRNEIVARHLYIAGYAARRYAGRGVDYDDLYQISSLALISAVDRYNIEKGVKFATFATNAVIGVIKNYFRDHAMNIRMPRRAGELLRKITAAGDELYAMSGVAPTPTAIAERIGVSAGEVIEAMEVREALNIESLDAVLGEGPLANMLGEEDKAYGNVEFMDFLRRAMSAMSETEKLVVRARFLQGRSQRDVAAEINVSQMYISRMERRIIDTFRRAMRDVPG